MEPIKPAENLEGRPIGVGFFTAAVVAGLLCVTNLPRAFAAPSDAGGGKEEDRLEPVLDMLQHSNTPNISHKFAEDGSIEVTAKDGIQTGDELFNQYKGEEDKAMPYHKFFTRFGFAPGVTEPVANLIAERSTIFFPQRAEV